MLKNNRPFLMPPTEYEPLHEIERAIRRGDKIRAIKIFRDAYGADLAAAKEAIESLQHGETINIFGKPFEISKLPEQTGIWRNDRGFSKPVETSLKIILAFLFVICFLILFYLM